MSNNVSQPGDIRVVAVVGAGFLGRQIAALAAASGRAVRVADVDPDIAARTPDLLRDYLTPPVTSGELDWDLDTVLARIEPAVSLEAAVSDADLVIEAVREDLPTKRAVLADVSRLNPTAFIATNSSSLMSSQLADVVSQRDRLVNLHFFPEFWHRSMVELMGCGETSTESMTILEAFGNSLGLFCAVVQGESKGFIINRVWRAVKRESLRVVDEGHASPEDVDRLWALFWGINYGPFGMMDEVGLDVIADIEDTYIGVATDPMDRRSQLLHELVDRNTLGIKTGSGFYTYPDPVFETPGWPRSSRSDSGDVGGQPDSD